MEQQGISWPRVATTTSCCQVQKPDMLASAYCGFKQAQCWQVHAAKSRDSPCWPAHVEWWGQSLPAAAHAEAAAGAGTLVQAA